MPDACDAPTRAASPLLLTVPEVAATLQCGRTYVYALISGGELPTIKLGRLTRIPAAAIHAFVARRLEEHRGVLDADVASWAAALPRRVGVAR